MKDNTPNHVCVDTAKYIKSIMIKMNGLASVYFVLNLIENIWYIIWVDLMKI